MKRIYFLYLYGDNMTLIVSHTESYANNEALMRVFAGDYYINRKYKIIPESCIRKLIGQSKPTWGYIKLSELLGK